MNEKVKTRDTHLLAPQGEQDSESVVLPPMPQFVHIGDQHVIWRNSARPRPTEPVRIITWEILVEDDEITIHADLEGIGEMREVDFRTVRMRLNPILRSEMKAKDYAQCHKERLRRSLQWQPIPADGREHLIPGDFDQETGIWYFGYRTTKFDSMGGVPFDGEIVPAASNQMYLERHMERQWIVYSMQCVEWAKNVSVDPCLNKYLEYTKDVCLARLLYFYRIPECRQLFDSYPNFAVIFCSPGILPEIDDHNQTWQHTATRLASLKPGELLEHLGMTRNQAVVNVFSRIKPSEIVPHFDMIRSTLNNPLAVKRLSETTCAIDITMLILCGRKYFPMNWPFFRQQCTDRPSIYYLLNRIDRVIDFFPYNLMGRRVRRTFRKARNEEEFKKIFRIASYLRKNRDLIYSR